MPANWFSTSFPGGIYDADGNALDMVRPRLEQAALDAYPHRSLVTDCDGGPVARGWLLDNDATPDAISPATMQEAVQFVLSGRGILVLARRPEPEMDVRDALLQALDLATAPHDMAGHG